MDMRTFCAGEELAPFDDDETPDMPQQTSEMTLAHKAKFLKDFADEAEKVTGNPSFMDTERYNKLLGKC